MVIKALSDEFEIPLCVFMGMQTWIGRVDGTSVSTEHQINAVVGETLTVGSQFILHSYKTRLFLLE